MYVFTWGFLFINLLTLNMRKFFKFLSVLFVLAMLPFAFLYVMEIYLIDFKIESVVKRDNFHIMYIGYFVVCLFITGVDYALTRDPE